MSGWIAKKIASRFVPRIKHGMQVQGALCKAFHRGFKEKALPIIATEMGKAGMESGKIAQKELGSKGMKAFAEMVERSKHISPGREITSLSDDSTCIKTMQCQFGLEGTSRTLYEAVMNFDHKMANALVGQDLKMQILTTLAAGDPYCEVMFSKK